MCVAVLTVDVADSYIKISACLMQLATADSSNLDKYIFCQFFIWDPPHISETIRAIELKFYTHLDGSSTLFGHENFSARGRKGVAPPSVNLGPPHISETIIVRKFKFYTHLDRVMCTFRE